MYDFRKKLLTVHESGIRNADRKKKDDEYEVLNGAFGFENACVGVIPTGTGNDFCRNFEDCNFTDIKAQFLGIPTHCDIIRYKGLVNGKTVEKYCANMFNIGFFFISPYLTTGALSKLIRSSI